MEGTGHSLTLVHLCQMNFIPNLDPIWVGTPGFPVPQTREGQQDGRGLELIRVGQRAV